MSRANSAKNTSSKKKQSKEFDKIINDLEQENNAYKTPVALFFLVGLFAAAAPISLYVTVDSGSTGIFDGKVGDNKIYYCGAVLITATALSFAYNIVYTRTRKLLFSSREVVATGSSSTEANGYESMLKVLTHNQSSHFALFIVNLVYLVFFLLSVKYFAPSLELEVEYLNFFLSSLLSSLSIIFLATINVI